MRNTEADRTARLYLLLFVAISAILAVTGYLYYLDRARLTRSRNEQDLNSLIDTKLDQVRSWRGECVGIGGIAFDNPAFVHAIPELLAHAASQRNPSEWSAALIPRMEYRSAILMDPAQRTRVVIIPGSSDPGDHAKATLDESLNRRTPSLSDLHASAEWPRIHMDLAIPAPIRIARTPGSRDTVLALMLLEIDPFPRLLPLIQAWPGNSRTGEVLLLRRVDEDVVYITPPRHRQQPPLQFRLSMHSEGLVEAHALGGQRGLLSGVDYRGVRVLAVARSVPHLPWTLVAKIDLAEVESPIRGIAAAVAGVVALTILATGALIALLWRNQRARFYQRQFQAEQERRALVEHFSLLTRYANDIVLLLDGQGRIREANERAVTSYGYAHDELLALNIADLRGPEFLGPQPDIDGLPSQDGVVFESVHRRKDGSTFPVEVSARVIASEGLKYWQEIIRDISERKRAAEELAWESRINEAVAGLAAAMLSQSSFEEASDLTLAYARDLTGSAMGFASNFDVAIRTIVSPSGEHATGIEEALREQGDLHRWLVERREPLVSNHAESDARLGALASPASPIRQLACAPFLIGGSVAGMIGVANPGRDYTERDATLVVRLARLYAFAVERVRSEAALRASEARLARAQRIARIGSFELELSTGRMRYSAETYRILDLAPDTPRTLAEILELQTPESRRALEEEVGRVVSEGRPGDIEQRITLRDGSERVIHLQAELVRDEAGAPLRLLGTLHDITEYRRLEDQLRQAQKMEAIGRLAGGVAHDFNNLLTVINGYSQLALSSMSDHNPARADLTEIRGAGERAAALTRQLLAFSRRQVLQPEVLRLNTVISRIENLLRRLIGEHIDLVTILDPDLGSVKVDPGQIEQVVMNLAVNSRDAMPDGGKLTIETTNVEMDETTTRQHVGLKSGRYVRLTICDTGVGMDATTRNRAFEPFFTTKPKGQGTGLGLSTVYGIVKQSGGDIWVYSEPRKGTVFKIYLPRVDDPAADQAPRPAAPDLRGSATVLMVEDEEGVRSFATRVLEEAGYTVLAAADAEEALALAEGHAAAIHLMVTDVIMPGLSGRQLAERLAGSRPDMRVLYISGYTDESIVRHGVLEAGIHFIQKPFSPRDLLAKVKEILG